MPEHRFEPGAVLRKREVLHGEVWLQHPVTVVSDVEDADDVLAVLLEDGSGFDFPEHPFGVHPWSVSDAWRGPSVLQLRRPDDWYSVWLFYEGGVLDRWYVNFEEPFVRRPDGIDTNDLALDLVVTADGAATWKDVEHLSGCLASGRIDHDQLDHVLAAATEVSARLATGDRWWSPWDHWTPDELDARERSTQP